MRTVKDPVCGMDVDPNKAEWSTEYMGQIYYFCSPQCKEEFVKNPDKYVTKSHHASHEHHEHGHHHGSHGHGHGCGC